MKHRKITLLATLLTLMIIMFSASVMASAGPNDPQGQGNGQQGNEQGQGNGQQGNYTYIYYPQYMTIHFMLTDYDSASGTMSSDTVPAGSSYTLPNCTFTPATGYIFDGYIICDASYGSQKYRAGDTIYLGSNNDLYIWCNFKRGNDKTVVSFAPQWDDTCTGTMEDIVVDRNTAFKAPACTFTPKGGYVFDHWYYDDEYKVNATINVGDKDTATLWAVFVKKGEQEVEVTFDNGLKGDLHQTYKEKVKYSFNPNTTREGYGTIILPEPDFKANGYKFIKWTTHNVSNDGNPGEEAVITTDGKQVIYAEMKKSFVTVTFDNGLAGDDNRKYTQDITFKEKNGKRTISLPNSKFEKVEGFKFVKWDLGSNGMYPLDTYTISKNTETLTIKAVMERTLTFDLTKCNINIDYGGDNDNYGSTKKTEKYLIYENYYYCGQPITPIFTVTDKNGTVLKEGIDYKFECSNNIEEGKNAKITVKGIGKSKGTLTKNFTILPLPFHDNEYYPQKAKVNVSVWNEYDYTGKTISPEFIVTFTKASGEQYIIPSSNFKFFDYKKKKKIGYYKVKARANSHNIEGDNNWVDGAWKIMPPGCPGISSVKFLNNGKELKVTFKKPSDDYAIYMQISSSASFNNAYYSPVVVGKGKKSYTYELENKLKNKKLYVRVRYHDEADGKWSDVKIIDPKGQK